MGYTATLTGHLFEEWAKVLKAYEVGIKKNSRPKLGFDFDKHLDLGLKY